MKTNTMNGYSYDILSNILTVNASFLKRASKIDSPEYLMITQFRKDNADVQIVKAESKASHKSITFKQMAAYIAIFDDKELILNTQFEKVKRMAKIQASPYKYVRNWFEATFPNYEKQVTFDEHGKMSFVADEEKKEIVESNVINAPAKSEHAESLCA